MRGSWRLKRRRKSGGVPDRVGALIRRTLAGGLAVAALVTATPAAAGQPPTELWDEFPLTQTLSEQSSPPPAPTERARPTPAETRQSPPPASTDQAASPLSYLVVGLVGLAIWAGIAVALRAKAWGWTPDEWRPRAERLAVALAAEQGEIGLLPAPAPTPVRAAGRAVAPKAKRRERVTENSRPPGKSSQMKKHPRSDAPPGRKRLSAGMPGGKRLSGPPAGKQASLPTPPRPTESEPRPASAPPAKEVRQQPPNKKPAAPRVQKAATRAAKEDLVLPAPSEEPPPPRHPTPTMGSRPGRRSRGPATAPLRFETCVIERWDGYVRSDFYAQAARPDGSQYLVGRSPMFSPRRRRSGERELEAHEALVEKLRAEGWESQGRAAPWYRQRFRRPSRTLHDLVSDLQPPRPS